MHTSVTICEMRVHTKMSAKNMAPLSRTKVRLYDCSVFFFLFGLVRLVLQNPVHGRGRRWATQAMRAGQLRRRGVRRRRRRAVEMDLDTMRLSVVALVVAWVRLVV